MSKAPSTRKQVSRAIRAIPAPLFTKVLYIELWAALILGALTFGVGAVVVLAVAIPLNLWLLIGRREKHLTEVVNALRLARVIAAQHPESKRAAKLARVYQGSAERALKTVTQFARKGQR